MAVFLTFLSGLGWVVVYEECIRLGMKQKICAMPFWALGLNFAWELIYTVSDIFLEAHGPLEGMNLVQAAASAAERKGSPFCWRPQSGSAHWLPPF